MLNVNGGVRCARFDQPAARARRLHPGAGAAVAGLRIGLPAEFFAAGLASDVARAVDAAIAEFRRLGCATVEVRLPNMRLAVPVYYVLAPAEASSNLARFDGVRYGYARRNTRPARHVLQDPRAGASARKSSGAF